MRHFYMPCIRLFNNGNKLMQDNYPEMVRRILVINPPSFFAAIFALCKPFLSKATRDRIHVVRNANPADALAGAPRPCPSRISPVSHCSRGNLLLAQNLLTGSTSLSAGEAWHQTRTTLRCSAL